MQPLQLWGGHECTVNRVGDRFFDQTVRSGHQDRPQDLDRFADLGIRKLRYPLLWERTAAGPQGSLDWSWPDARLDRMRKLGIEPILGLVHHGSGPAWTSLVAESFAPGLAAFARAAAERYPHIRDWTPVNEPLTTARFSCLYGHWHPHARDERLFWLALLNQVDGVRLAMAQIRQVIPDARLIQTEDLGRTYSTRALAHQADFDNERRWLTWDLLSGQVVEGHRLWRRLCDQGFERRLEEIAKAPCPPDVIGVNHYLTSDRFLDHRCERYPAERCGGNAFMRYADIEAIRVLNPAPCGLEGALEDAAARYGLPLAITEAHNGCTREEQVRWFEDAWGTAERLRGRGVAIEAVTSWALLGAYDWDSLLTRQDGHYEAGAFDVRTGDPRPTALTETLRRCAAGEKVDAVSPGWWRRDIRLQYQPVFRSVETPEARPSWRVPAGGRSPLMIVGASGTLGRALARSCEWRGLDYVLTTRRELNLQDGDSIAAAIERHAPWAVVNAAGFVRVDDAEDDEQACFLANAEGAIRLAEACRRRNLPFVGLSSDLVFDGDAGRAYHEGDAPCPLSVYGRSKAQAEGEILAMGGKALIVRTAAFFSPYDPHNFASSVARTLAGDQALVAADDVVVSPTYVPDLVDALLDLLIDGESGLWHLANEGEVTWAGFAQKIAGGLGLDPSRVSGVPHRELGWRAPRPRHAPLGSRRGQLLPPLDHALERYADIMKQSSFLTEAGLQAEAREAWARL